MAVIDAPAEVAFAVSQTYGEIRYRRRLAAFADPEIVAAVHVDRPPAEKRQP